MIEIGCQTYSLRAAALPEMLASLRKAGFHGMELWVGHASYRDGADGAARVRAAVRDIGLTIQAYSVGGLGREGVAVVEAALLIESGYHGSLERLIVVWCTPEQQLSRLVSGRGMTEEQARRRIASQLSLEEKRKLADDEIDCSGTLDHTRSQVIALVGRLKQLAVAPSPKL